MQQSRPRAHKTCAALAAALATVWLVVGFPTGHAQAQAAAPATTLGTWFSGESPGDYFTEPGQTPNVANMYLYWAASFPTTFADQAEAAGATPLLEIEPWQGAGGCSYSGAFPSMTTIGANGSAISTYLKAFGSAIAAFGHPVIVTFAHEFNISGQYPWATGDCEGTTPAQWIKAWDTVRSDVDATAGGLASFMWAPGADTGGPNQNPTPYWPGPSEVDMVGVDGYPNTQWGPFTSFSALFGPVFDEIHAETSLPIFLAETDLAPLDGSGYQSIAGFVSDLCSHGGDGLLEFEDGTPAMTDAQWSELDQALASDCQGGGVDPPPTGSGGPVVGYEGLCLDDQGASTADYNPVDVATCNGGAAQQWTFDLSNSYTLQVLGKCLDVQNGATTDGTSVDLYDCDDSGGQVWVPQSDGALVNPQSGKCLDDTDWGGPGTQVQIWDCWGGDAQQWTLP